MPRQGQGREAAHNIAKPNNLVAFDKVPVFWSSIGKGLRYLGTGAGFDDVYTDGNVKELKVGLIRCCGCRSLIVPQFVSYQAKKGKITAVCSMQNDPYVAQASELMRLDIMPSLDEIKGGKASWRACAPPVSS